jgi:hypothetical protein
MSETDQDWTKALERTHEAVRNFARAEFRRHARKITYRMRRFPASGIYGDDLRHKTLWDEYCYERLHGPTDGLERAWDDALRPYLDEVVESIPAEAAILLSIYAAWDLDGAPEDYGSTWPEGIKHTLVNVLIDEARSNEKNIS